MDFEIYEEIDEFLKNAQRKIRRLIIKKLRFFSGREKRLLEKSEDIKRLHGGVYEVIIGPWRILGYLINTTLHLTVIFRKQSKKTPEKYIHTAMSRGIKIEQNLNKK